MMKASKRLSKGLFLSVSALSAVGLLATLSLSASAQTGVTRDDAAAETSPASPVMQNGTMTPSSGSVTNMEADEDALGVTRDDAAAETSPASPVMRDGTMIPSNGSVTNVESDEDALGVTRDDAAAETSPASPVMQNGTATPSRSTSGSSAAPTSTTTTPANNSPRALW
ncbi:MAG: hypothetical protein WA783_18605 [Phormidesmis sp.]